MSRLRKATNRLLKDPDYDVDDKVFYDEQEQEQIIKNFEIENLEAEQQYKTAFIAVMVAPTPIFLILPYCRRNSLLSLFALSSIFISVYTLLTFARSVPVLYFYQKERFCRPDSPALTPLEKYLPPLNILLAFSTAAWGLIKHYPWMGYDYIWFLPVISVGTTLLLRQWMSDSMVNISVLKKARYGLKGA